MSDPLANSNPGTAEPTTPASTFPAAAIDAQAALRPSDPKPRPLPDLPVKPSIAAKRFLGTSALHMVLAVMSFAMVLPFTWMVLTSLKQLQEVGLDTWLPASVEWAPLRIFGFELFNVPRNYQDVFSAIPFARYYWNSLFVAAWVTFLQVFTSSLAAFSFARLQWPGRDKVFVLYLCTMMLPGLVMMIPNYQIMIELGLVDSMVGLILPGAFSAFGTFLLRQFMLTIPSSLDEAAEIDGASKWRLYWDIILPLSRPGLITLAIFTYMGNYNSFFWPLVMLRSEHKYTLPIGLMYFDSTAGQETNLLMAAVTMSVIPMVLVFIVLQKYLVKGIQLGAVKG
ncbi:MAG: carbohydrate ABC transporter permease [Phycisphaeraceae bacterium]